LSKCGSRFSASGTPYTYHLFNLTSDPFEQKDLSKTQIEDKMKMYKKLQEVLRQQAEFPQELRVERNDNWWKWQEVGSGKFDKILNTNFC